MSGFIHIEGGCETFREGDIHFADDGDGVAVHATGAWFDGPRRGRISREAFRALAEGLEDALAKPGALVLSTAETRLSFMLPLETKTVSGTLDQCEGQDRILALLRDLRALLAPDATLSKEDLAQAAAAKSPITFDMSPEDLERVALADKDVAPVEIRKTPFTIENAPMSKMLYRPKPKKE
jgi:hypothetical protein